MQTDEERTIETLGKTLFWARAYAYEKTFSEILNKKGSPYYTPEQMALRQHKFHTDKKTRNAYYKELDKAADQVTTKWTDLYFTRLQMSLDIHTKTPLRKHELNNLVKSITNRLKDLLTLQGTGERDDDIVRLYNLRARFITMLDGSPAKVVRFVDDIAKSEVR